MNIVAFRQPCLTTQEGPLALAGCGRMFQFFDRLVGGAAAPEARRDICRRGSCVPRSHSDCSGAPRARQFALDFKLSHELPVVLPAGPFGLQVRFLGLNGAIHVGRPRYDGVITGRGRGELAGE